MATKAFNDVLREAIEDIANHGYDSAERIKYWSEKLKEAAQEQVGSQPEMDRMMRDALEAVYRRLVERGRILEFHPSVEKFTIDKIKPELRAELDRRIIAAVDLIKRNRAEAVAKTLHRFEGWSTSIPKGGSDILSRREVASDLKKPLQRLSYHERFVAIDQGHKLRAAISDVVAKDAGAIAVIWHSQWRRNPARAKDGYQWRRDHKERDQKIYLIRDSWAKKAGLVKPSKNGYYDEITQAAEEPYCSCAVQYIYNLRQLPEENLTAKGKETLTATRTKFNDTRTDSTSGTGNPDLPSGLWSRVKELDRLGYLKGFDRLRVTADTSEWHARQDPDNDEVVVQAKLLLKPIGEQIHVLLHEAGHRGQEVDKANYDRFKKEHLNRLPYFIEMANQVHLRDFERVGYVDSIAAEVWAESYSRFCLDLPMPGELKSFWNSIQ